ncbi:MAG TPA: CDP-alcohol phosphatidyltransferase family protein [Rariglobus sp.]
MDTPEDRRPLKSRSLGWVQALARLLVKLRVKPNAISTAGIGFALLAFGVLFWFQRGGLPAWLALLLAAACVQLRLLCNMFDGLVAVEGGLKSKGGDLFNEIPDRIEDVLFLAGAGYASGKVELGWICAVLAVFAPYVRAFGASLGHGQDFCGPCAKPHRMFFLTVGLIAQAVALLADRSWNLLCAALWLIAVLTALTVVRRTVRLYRKSA